jgi:hypothetical protein
LRFFEEKMGFENIEGYTIYLSTSWRLEPWPACLLMLFWGWLLINGDFIEQISGQDKLAQNNLNGVVPVPNSSNRQRPSHPVLINNLEIPNHSMRLSAPSRVSAYPANDSLGNVAYFIFLSPIVLCESLLFLFLSLFAEQVFIFLHC